MTDFLPRLELANELVTPPMSWPMRRTMSPAGGSTLMTSAPWSASIMVATGPEIMAVRSTIRIPASGPGIARFS